MAFEVVVPDVAEVRSGDPGVVVLDARRKATAGRAEAGGEGLALGVDTDVALDGRLLGKPDDERGARERLETLSGRTHEVLSGVVLLDTGDRQRDPRRALGDRPNGGHLQELDEATIDLYLASEEWRVRAGAYAIQGLARFWSPARRAILRTSSGCP